MAREDKAFIKIDLAQSKLHVNIRDIISLSLHFDSVSRRFYLAVIALVLHEMKKSGEIKSIPLENHYDTLALLNETVGGGAGSSDKGRLLSRIYIKWKDALPGLEHSPLFRVLGKKKEYEDAAGRAYEFTDQEKDAWANLFDYSGSHEHIRLRFSIDKLGVTLDKVLIEFVDDINPSGDDSWDAFLKSLSESTEKQTISQQISTEPVDQASAQVYPHPESLELGRQKAEEEKLNMIQRYLPAGLVEKIIAQRGEIEGERKQVTIMFCNMEGYTDLSEVLEPEEIYSIMKEVFEILIIKVHDFGGTVNEMRSDGIMALFGAPIAQENSPQRAICSALTMHREMVKFSDRMKIERQTPPLKMCIGIHTGPVVVGSIGNDLRVEFKAVGKTVNLASTMKELAEPGTTYVTQDTYKLTEGIFRFEAMEGSKVKGKEAHIETYRVIAPTTRRTRFDVYAERGLTPFVGREKELGLLLEGYQRAREGRGNAFSIISEAGVGKSRLLYEFRKAVANEDLTFLEGRCLSYGKSSAYSAVIDLLKLNFDIGDSDSDLNIKDKVTSGLKTLGVDEASTLPYLLELLAVKDAGMDMTGMSPKIKKSRILEALKRIVLQGSELRTLIIAVEDLHWSDPSSEEAFKYLLDNISGANVMLIFTYRTEFTHTWGGRSYHNQVNLNRLNNRDSLSMVTNLLGTEEIENNLRVLVFDKTEGVPFFIEELTKSLIELQIIERKDGKFCLTKNAVDVTIPSTIQDVIMARVDSLPVEAKGILQIGSVIGREFSYDLIKQVTGQLEQALLSNLSVLKDSELIYERGIFPQSNYIFKHALTQDVVYESILSKRKKELHVQTGKAIEELYGERLEEFYEMLAQHYTEAGLIEQAIPYWKQAGQRATQRSAYAEAISHITRGINLLKALPDTEERAQLELVLQNTLGQALTAMESHASPKVEQAFARAHELCRKVGETPQLFSVLRGLISFYLMRGELKTAREAGEQFLNLANRQQDPAVLLTANLTVGQVLLNMGEFISARKHLERGIALYDPQQHRFTIGDSGVLPLISSAHVLWQLGYPNQSLERSHKGLNLAHELSHPYSIGWALTIAAELHLRRREAGVCQEKAEEAILICTEQGFQQWLTLATILRGWALVMQGQGEEGILRIRQGRADLQSAGVLLMWTTNFGVLVEAYRKMGQVEEGLRVLAEALSLIGKIGVRNQEAEWHRLKGELLLAKSEGNQAEAEACFNKALEIARSQKAKSWELRAAMSLSHLWHKQGKRREALDLLASVYNWFTEGFDTADLKDAKALLEELS